MVGVKVLRSRWAQERKHIEDFHREAQLGMTLMHENIVPIYDHGTKSCPSGDIHYLVMEFVEGGNLRDFIQIRQQLSALETMQYALGIAEGLKAALAMGFTHRDLKLTNVLMSSKGVPKLVDFGLAGSDDESHHQRAVEYATIEKSTGASQNDPRSDLFFLGVILYELLSGQPPYSRTNDIMERKQVSRYRNIRPIEQVAPHVPQAVHGVISRLLSFAPEGRYQSADELICSLQQLIPSLEEGQASPATEETSFEQSSGSTISHAQPTDLEQKLPTVLCVEHRVKHQNVLREYLSKRGFRPLMVGDTSRALNRLKSNNVPDCIVFFGESIDEDIVNAFSVASDHSKQSPLAVVAVLSKEQNELKSRLKKTSSSRVLLSPITLRDLRKEVHLALQHAHQDSTELDSIVS
jgi:serine/threonine protein kinase